MKSNIPEKGDFIILTFDPQSGHEQKGRRPAIVANNFLFNKHTGLAIVCPITNTFRNMPFHIKIPDRSSLSGYIMVEQIKSVDYISSQAKFVEKADTEIINELLAILDACVYQDE
ncbi:type II toxin-antitoxin system PemK/MazF family toxin [candidate division KSB1 bacterium]|nr:type II toxin-antitoxin system PemK/MazF family toxin [candidate division KSB1 bacterium]MBL7092954.1 type II toxin-antitoxin system PemK/MazF family toxin [candidate division KSB1 bacterium]